MKVVKTIKLYIDGAFVRTESGRSYSYNVQGTESQFARLCRTQEKTLEMRLNLQEKDSSLGLLRQLITALRFFTEWQK